MQRLLFIFLSFFIVDHGYAESPVPVLNELVVTAPRLDSIDADDVDTDFYSGFHQTITRDQWSQDSANLGDVIAAQSGAQIRKTGGIGGFSLLSLRGSLSDQVAVYLDGFPLNDANGGGVNLNTITLSEIERIEIYRGVSPLQSAYAPIGGSIFLFSRRGDKNQTSEISLGAGSQNSRQAAAHIAGNALSARWLLTMDYLHSDNNIEYLNNNGTVWNADDDKTETRRNNQFERYNLLNRWSYAVSNTSFINLSYRFLDWKQALPSWNNRAIATNLAHSTHHMQVKWNDFTPRFGWERTSLTIDFQDQVEVYDDKLSEIGLGAQWEQGRTRVGSLSWYGERLIGNTLFQSRIGWSNEYYFSTDLLKNNFISQYQRQSLNATTGANIFLFGQDLLVKPGVVFQSYVYNVGVVARTSAWVDGGYASPQIGVVYHWSPQLQINANINRALREPALYELFGDRGLFLGNSSLVAERSTNSDIGVQWRHYITTLPMTLNVELVAFSNWISDGITKTYNAQGVGRAINIAQANVRGVEFTLETSYSDFGSVRYDATFLTSENLTPNSVYYKKQLPGRFGRSQSIRYQKNMTSTISGYMQLQQQADLFYDSMNLLPASKRITVEAALTTKTPVGEFSARGENLTNQQYSDFNGYPYADRLFFVSYKNSF